MAKRVATRTLDFSNVKESSGINPKHKEDGEYLGTVVEVRDDPAKDGEAMWLFLVKLEDDKTASYPFYCKLVDNQLWKLRNLFLAAGVPIPKKAVKIDPNKVVGKQVGVILEGEEYEGKMKSVISGLIPVNELSDYDGAATESDDDDEEDDDEEEAPAPKKRGRPKKVVEEEDDDDDDEEEAPAPKKRGRPKKVVEPEEDDDDEEEEDEPAPKKRGRGRPRKVVEPEPEEDDDEDEEDEEPEPPKRKRGRPAKAAAAPVKKKRRAVADDDDDDLEIDL